jgi:oligopeptide transport system substrate-binding protein
VPSQDIAWVKRKLPGTLRIAPYMMVNIVLFNLGAKPVDDRRVRSALSLAIDRETIAERVMGAGEAPAYSFVPPHMPNYPGTAELSFRHLPMRDRRARARALLAEAGYGPSNRLAFDFNIVDQTTVHNVSVVLQSMWREIGVDVRIVASDAKAHISLLMKEEFSVAWGQWAADYLDARNFLVLGETSARHLNDSGFSDPRFDALMARSDRIADVHTRGTCMAQAEQILLDAVAIAPVYFSVSRTLVSPAVTGWVDNAINVHRIRWLSLERAHASA